MKVPRCARDDGVPATPSRVSPLTDSRLRARYVDRHLVGGDILRSCHARSSTKTLAVRTPRRYTLPDRADPGYDLAAARALLRGADQGDTVGAEAATGYYWGDPALFSQVERLLLEAQRRPERPPGAARRAISPRPGAPAAGRGARCGTQSSPGRGAGDGRASTTSTCSDSGASGCSATRPTTSSPISGRAVDRFESKVEARGGDTLTNAPDSAEPDNPAFVLPERREREAVAAYVRRSRVGRGAPDPLRARVRVRRLGPQEQAAPAVGEHVHHVALGQPALHPLPELDVQQVAVRLEEGVPHLARAGRGRRGTPPERRRARPRRTRAPPRTPPRSWSAPGSVGSGTPTAGRARRSRSR